MGRVGNGEGSPPPAAASPQLGEQDTPNRSANGGDEQLTRRDLGFKGVESKNASKEHRRLAMTVRLSITSVFGRPPSERDERTRPTLSSAA